MLKQYFGGSSDLKITAESAWTWPVPNIDAKCSAGNGVLDSVRKTYHGMKATYNYTFPYPWDGVSGYNVNVTATRKSSNTTSTGNNTFTVTQSAISRASSGIRPSSGATLIAVFALFALVS